MVIRISSIFCGTRKVSVIFTRKNCTMKGYTHLAHHKIALSELNQHLLGTKCIVELQLEFLDLHVGILKSGQSLLVFR